MSDETRATSESFVAGRRHVDTGMGYALCGAYKGDHVGVANCPECLATERDLREAEARQGHQAGWES